MGSAGLDFTAERWAAALNNHVRIVRSHGFPFAKLCCARYSSCPPFPLWDTALEVRGFVDAARAFVLGNLGIRTQGTRAIHFTVGAVRSLEPVRGLAVFHPLLERAHFVENIWTFAAAAMAHSGFQKKPDVVGCFGFAAHG